MPSVRLKDTQTVNVDVAGAGLSITNISRTNVKVYVDWNNHGTWSALTGEVTLAPGKSLSRTSVQLGHSSVRIGARGDAGGDLVAVNY